MKKINYIKYVLLGFIATASLSSCLKDKNYVDFSQGGQSAELTLSGLNSFGADAILSDTAVIQFGVNIASSSTLSTDSKITVAVDPPKVAAYLATNSAIAYELMPENVYTFKTTVVDIPAGQRLKILTFTVYKNLLDPTKSYMLPISITSAPGLTISANNSTHYYHVIGNDFAGTYQHQFIRTPAGGDFSGVSELFLPVSPTQFEVNGGYYNKITRYEVSFTKTGTGASATYSHFAISINADDTKVLTDAGISITAPPTIVGYVEKEYTFAQALQLFSNGFTYSVLGSSGARVNLDKYTK